mgnify:CR=1 FL=1
MPLTTRYAQAATTAKVEALSQLLNGGSLCLYTGVQPKSADQQGLTDQACLATIPLGNPAFHPSLKGTAKSYPLPKVSAEAEGEASWFRASDAYDRPILDGSVGTGDANLNLSSVRLSVGVIVEILEFELQELTGT